MSGVQVGTALAAQAEVSGSTHDDIYDIYMLHFCTCYMYKFENNLIFHQL